MPTDTRRDRERTARRQLIVATARRLAEAEGWEAVTTRRLSTEIEYSQPVLYKHFAAMEHIASAVALDGFGELTAAMSAAQQRAGTPAGALNSIAEAYLDFAAHNPAVYDAMFTRTTTLRFAADETPPELTAGFALLRDTVGAVAADKDTAADTDTLTELFWAALHGLVSLSRAGRLRPGHESERLRALVDGVIGTG